MIALPQLFPPNPKRRPDIEYQRAPASLLLFENSPGQTLNQLQSYKGWGKKGWKMESEAMKGSGILGLNAYKKAGPRFERYFQNKGYRLLKPLEQTPVSGI